MVTNKASRRELEYSSELLNTSLTLPLAHVTNRRWPNGQAKTGSNGITTLGSPVSLVKDRVPNTLREEWRFKMGISSPRLSHCSLDFQLLLWVAGINKMISRAIHVP